MVSLNGCLAQDVVERIDQRVFLHDLSWQDYEALLAMRGERGGTRIAYLDGEVEIMTPSVDHEMLKKTLARLVEAYAEERGIDLQGAGSWTLRKQAKERGLEPDECYVLGPFVAPPEIPDLAIEVVWTHGGLDKLSIYQGLGIPEVWIWREGALQVHWLESGSYQPSQRSRLLPELDLALIERLMARPSQTQAVRELRQVLRGA